MTTKNVSSLTVETGRIAIASRSSRILRMIRRALDILLIFKIFNIHKANLGGFKENTQNNWSSHWQSCLIVLHYMVFCLETFHSMTQNCRHPDATSSRMYKTICALNLSRLCTEYSLLQSNEKLRLSWMGENYLIDSKTLWKTKLQLH